MARWDCPVDLVAVRAERDRHGVARRARTSRRVYGNRLSVGFQSFWAASQAGVRPDAVVQVRASEYRGETEAVLSGRRYSVARAEQTGPETVRLTLTEEVGDR